MIFLLQTNTIIFHGHCDLGLVKLLIMYFHFYTVLADEEALIKIQCLRSLVS